MYNRTRKLTTIGMLCALAYVVMVVGRFPVVLFLKYDPKDVIIAIGGLIFGPLTSFLIALIVAFVEMFTVSENGLFGFLMNLISSCSFACTAAFIYKKSHKLSGAIAGLLCGCMAVTMLLYKPVVTALRHAHLLEEKSEAAKPQMNIGVVLVSLLMLATCVLLILSFHGVF